MFVVCLLIACVFHANAAYERNGRIRVVKDYVLDAELRKTPIERRIFVFKRNGVKVDVKVVPSDEKQSARKTDDDHFPVFPVKDIGKCIIEFSLGCIKKRFVRFLETVGRLNEITLLGQDVKLVKIRAARSDERPVRNDSDVSIERSMDDLFDSFTLRITLPRWDGEREKNQIDVMLDETATAEGRGKKGGGGKGKGGKCKMMMMGMLMLVKMKLMGAAVLKGMMMGGMSLMLSMMMLSGKFGKGGGGPWQSGGSGPWQSGGSGPWQGGGGGQLKEIVLLTKSSGGGGGGGGGGCCGGPSDSYGAPPPSSYGVPSGGGGGYGGGGYGGGGGGGGYGGWGRSFHKRPTTILSHDNMIKAETADEPNRAPSIGEAVSNTESLDYPDYLDSQELQSIAAPNFATSNWNATHYNASREYRGTDASLDSIKNHSKVESMAGTKGRSFNGNPSTNVSDMIIGRNVETISANRSDIVNGTSIVRPAYTDEWQATAGKVISSNVPSSDNSNARVVELQRIDSRVKDIPLLREI